MDICHLIMAITLINISDDNIVSKVDEYKPLKLLISKHFKTYRKNNVTDA